MAKKTHPNQLVQSFDKLGDERLTISKLGDFETKRRVTAFLENAQYLSTRPDLTKSDKRLIKESLQGAINAVGSDQELDEKTKIELSDELLVELYSIVYPITKAYKLHQQDITLVLQEKETPLPQQSQKIHESLEEIVRSGKAKDILKHMPDPLFSEALTEKEQRKTIISHLSEISTYTYPSELDPNIITLIETFNNYGKVSKEYREKVNEFVLDTQLQEFIEKTEKLEKLNLEDALKNHDLVTKHEIRYESEEGEKYKIIVRKKTGGRSTAKKVLYLFGVRDSISPDLVGMTIVTPNIGKVYEIANSITQKLTQIQTEYDVDYNGVLEENSNGDLNKIKKQEKELRAAIKYAKKTGIVHDETKNKVDSRITIKGGNHPFEIQVVSENVYKELNNTDGILSHDTKYYKQRSINECNKIIEQYPGLASGTIMGIYFGAIAKEKIKISEALNAN